MDRFTELHAALHDFTRRRDWGQYHDPKSLLLALVGEVGEVAELMQWTREAEVRADLSQGDGKAHISDELADVLMYLMLLADSLDVDLITAAHAKLERNEARFPTSQGQGSTPSHARHPRGMSR